nr:uncharacterized protein LOC124064690 isoform X2 [Scatophagus argus]
MQESGDAGLSSDMEHKFSDNYTERGLIPADKSSFVTPIPKKELDNTELPEQKMWSHPSGFEHADSHSLKAGEVVVPENNTPAAPSENNPEEETAEIIPSSTVIAQEESDAEDRGGDNNIIDTERDTGGKTEKPDGPRLVPLVGRNSRHHRKRAGRMRKFYLLCWMLFSVPGAGGSHEVKYFTCVDKDRCHNLMTIYGHSDTTLYQRALDQAFPGCCKISPPAPPTCTVCCDLNNAITITCPEGVTPMEVEDSDGEVLKLVSIPKPGAQQPTCGSHGLIPSFALFVIAVSAVIYKICSQD